MISRLNKFNTLRNQILIVFLIAIIFVLFFVNIIIFSIVSNLLRYNAEIQIQETTVQVSERLETLYRQIDIISRQVTTNLYVQQLLLDEVDGKPTSFNQRQSLMQVVNNYQVYSDGIHSFELYLEDGRRLFPLNEASLSSRVNKDWIEKARDGKGKMVWIGQDPRDPNLHLAIRQVSLIDRWFSNGGYLLISMHKNYFTLHNASKTTQQGEYTIILDEENSPISLNYYGDVEEIIGKSKKLMNIDNRDYIVSKVKSDLTGWTVMILTPVYAVMKGISVLRTAILFSGIIGFIIFFYFSFFFSTMVTQPVLNLIKTMENAKLHGLKPISEKTSTVELTKLNKTYNELVENINHLIKVVYEKEILINQVELKALQAQINPHFLYNTLEALYWSLEEKGEEELAEIVIAMSELFRYTITSSRVEDELVFIQDELQHIERYLKIMKMRLGDKLTWDVSLPPGINIKIPKLIIQPLVENAILHGIGNKNDKGTVSVIVQEVKPLKKLVIKVMDDGIGINKTTLHSIRQSLKSGIISSFKGKGVALVNIYKRLQLNYIDKGEIEFSIESKENEWTCVTFEIPIGEEIENVL
ncbi:sensor histidine kinase [Alkalithermobacter paradoxus]|uniref:Sensor histidine kinase YpdA n=1 Tax=Alkalithermobacter paradoxus TaxID=29349 RepID=A0A1V4I798_9FIRM|nr:sensor histidine kinase YpdA [[Clostridium] thermoalcaliphilum]